MSILGNQTLLNTSTAFYLTDAGFPSVSTTIAPITLIGGIANSASEVVYNLPVGGQAELGLNLSPGYYFYTAVVYLSDLTYSGTPDGNIMFQVVYEENSVAQSTRSFRVYVSSEDNSTPGVSFSIGIPIVQPQGTGNIAIVVTNYTGVDIGNAYTLNIEQYNFEKTTSQVSVVVL
jgi:hypothetical protein